MRPTNTQPSRDPRPTGLSRARLAGAALLIVAGSLGCALHKANSAFAQGDYDHAVAAYREVVRKDPSNVKARIGVKRASQMAAEQHLQKARNAEQHGQDDRVLQEVRQAVVLDPDNQVAQDWLIRLEEKAQREKAVEERDEDVEAAKARAEVVGPVQLNPRSLEGVDLNFSRRTSLRDIFAAISKASGINIIMHQSFQDQSASIDLRGLTFQRALDTLMLQNDLFYKVIDANTIMVFKSTPQNKEQFKNQIIKTYYLSNAEPDPVRSTLTTINPQLRVFTDKRMNALIVRAEPWEVGIVDRIVAQLDKPKAEVMVYMELMEVSENTLEQVGLLPVLSAGDSSGIYRIGATTVNNSTGLNSNTSLNKIKRSDIRVLFPNLALDALKTSGDARLVASPNVRVVSGEKGEVNIGEKISTTQSQISLPTGAAGGAAGSTGGIVGGIGGVGQTSFSYEDVGVKISVEPRVHFDNTVTLKIEASVTTKVSETVPGRPDIGRREIKTLARLKDGETAIFGGLLKDEEQKSLQGIWGLTDIPIIGRLLGHSNRTKAKTDVILTIRAALVRKPNLSEQDFAGFNPDDAQSRSGPFTPKKPKGEAASTTPGTPTATVKPAGARPNPTGGRPAQPVPQQPQPAQPPKAAAPNQPQAAPQPAPGQPAEGAQPQPEGPGEDQPQAATPAQEEAANANGGALPPQPSPAPAAPNPADAPRNPGASDLVLFLSPVAQQAAKGEHVQLRLLISGGAGLSSGNLDLQMPGGLKFVSASLGDFLSGGSLEQSLTKEGLLRLTFRRGTQAVDSGAFATLEFEATAPGNQPVLIQGGNFLVGSNPVSGRWVNALVTVQ